MSQNILRLNSKLVFRLILAVIKQLQTPRAVPDIHDMILIKVKFTDVYNIFADSHLRMNVELIGGAVEDLGPIG